MSVMRSAALKLEGVEEGVACEGTPLQRHTVKVNGKAFLFLGLGDAMTSRRSSVRGSP